MKQQQIPTAIFVAAALALSAMVTLATPVLAQTDEQPIYGGQLMSEQERQAHRTRMYNADTPEERERIRAEHHEQMRLRAKEQGITLPEAPPARGMGPGMHHRGQGPGMYRPGQGPGMSQPRGNLDN